MKAHAIPGSVIRALFSLGLPAAEDKSLANKLNVDPEVRKIYLSPLFPADPVQELLKIVPFDVNVELGPVVSRIHFVHGK